MVAFGKFPELFRSIVGIVKPPAKPFRHDAVLARYQDCHRPMIRPQVFVGRKLVAEQASDGNDPDVRLCDSRKMIVRGEQDHAGNFVRMVPGKKGCNAGPERFADEVSSDAAP